ncbi:MAG: hypothetical protein QOI20_3262 [Acidimicrobiaceae bacterium]|jgi:hypothetical protein|nr:hypothetical protein [Acidimicrobiaceae bacterium]
MGLFDTIGNLFGGSKPKVPPPTKPAGSDGQYAPSGYIIGNFGERNPALQGAQKWVTQDNTIANCITVAAAIRVRNALTYSAKWTVEPNKRGGKNAERMADIVREGVVEARLDRPWKAVVRKAVFGSTFRGFSLYEPIIRRRSDGAIILRDLQHRPQWTIARWDKPNEQEAWRGVEQQTKTARYYIPRERLLYSVNDGIGDSPDGIGLLRHLAEHARRVERYEQLEGWGFETDLRGIPVGGAPLKALEAEAMANGITEADGIRAYVDAQTKFFRDILEKHIKNPELSVLLDSSVYEFTSADGGKIGSVARKWIFDVVKGNSTGQAEVRKAIDSINREMLRVMGAEWLFMGDGEGARSVHEDKTAMFGLILNGDLDDFGDCATRDVARPITLLNGGDPDTDTPTIKAEPIPTQSIEAAARTLLLLAQAGAPLQPGDEAPNIVRGRADLPPQPELSVLERDAMLPRRNTPPDPTKGEVDVPVDDLGTGAKDIGAAGAKTDPAAAAPKKQRTHR